MLVFPRIAKDMRLESAGVDSQQINSPWELTVRNAPTRESAFYSVRSWAACAFGLHDCMICTGPCGLCIVVYCVV